MQVHEDDDIFLITGKQLNKCIWSIEQMMDLFYNNDEMLNRLGREREELINKMSYLKILDNLGLKDDAPSDTDVSFTEFLNKFGLKPYDKNKGGEK
tara:strand:+ start:194 stop:481 length:288 start_codon:yes stop_codon:yes gene_type:complete